MDSPRLGAVFIRQHHDSKKEIGSYGAFLHVSRLNPTTAQRDLTREQALRTEVEAALSNAQERLAKDQQAWASERDRLKAEVLLEHSANKHLRQERDDAMREAARQEGKALALLGQLEEVRGELIAQRNSQDRVAKTP